MTTLTPEPTPNNTFYVQAVLDPVDPKRAACAFYTDGDCNPTSRVVPPLNIPKAAGGVYFVNVPTAANLLLVGAVSDRVDTGIINPGYGSSTGNTVCVLMPTAQVISKGVLLVFSSQGAPTQLYSSADPTIVNDDV